MGWRLALIALAGCGRIGFDVASQPGTDSGPISHDETAMVCRTRELQINVNNLRIEIRSLRVITSS